MNIIEAIAPPSRDDRPGDVIFTFFNGLTFNETAFDRACAEMCAEARAHREMRLSLPPRKLTDDEWDDQNARDEKEWWTDGYS